MRSSFTKMLARLWFAFFALWLSTFKTKKEEMIMGMPNEKELRLEIPTIAEKIRLLELGKELGQSLDLENLADILEEVKKILLPLVPWLDKPLFPHGSGFTFDSPPPKAFQKVKAITLIRNNFISISLERSGTWFVWISCDEPAMAYWRFNSTELAKYIELSAGDFMDRIRGYKQLAKELDFLKKFALYDALVLKILSEFIGSVSNLIKEREARIEIMRSRLDQFDQFIEALDPLLSNDKELTLKEFSILREHSRGASVECTGYFASESLDDFWKVIKNRKENRDSYRGSSSDVRYKTLGNFLERLVFKLQDIEDARSRRRNSAQDLAGFSSGRLPFSQEELNAIKNVAKSITE